MARLGPMNNKTLFIDVISKTPYPGKIVFEFDAFFLQG